MSAARAANLIKFFIHLRGDFAESGTICGLFGVAPRGGVFLGVLAFPVC